MACKNEAGGQILLGNSYTLKQTISAWSVHALTMSGVLWAGLATLALIDQDVKMMWLWLGIALIVDGLDGTFARKAQVKQVIPWFNGTTLDSVVDYLTWTFIPAVFIYQQLDFGPKWLAFLVMITVAASSMFCYCNENERSSDNYFVGFPAAWNIVAFYLWILDFPMWANLTTVVVLVIMTLVPTAYMHPFRTRRLMPVNILATVAWVAVAISLVVTYPSKHWAQWTVLAIASLWFMAISAWRSVHGIDKYEMD